MRRRHFLASLPALLIAARLPRRRAVRLRIALMDATAQRSLRSLPGAILGFEEAGRLAEMLGGEVRPATEGDPPPQAIVGGWRDRGPDPDPDLHTVREPPPGPFGPDGPKEVVLVNVGDASDALRARCRPNLFHVAPSEAMQRDARALAGGSGQALAWHASLEPFGAGQLNDRFRASFRTGMDGDAWTTWFAIKMLAEAALRAESDDPRAIAAYLARPGTRFDGHKGRPLSFRPWDHQLRQPLYVLQGSSAPTEVPPRGGGTVAGQLDRLGASAARPGSACE